jgi:TolB-like protein/Tfp pilus assembly protein PilF
MTSTRDPIRPILYIWAAVVVVAAGFWSYMRFFGPAEASRPIASVAVLPLEAASTGDAALATAVVHDVIDRLTRVPDLKVINWTSVLRYRDAPDSISRIARELDVVHVLTGSIQIRGEAVTLTVQLRDATADRERWSERFNADAARSPVFAGDLAPSIVDGLEIPLPAADLTRLRAAATSDHDAYMLYARGLTAAIRGSADALRRAAELFREAVAHDDAFALAQVALAETCMTLSLLDHDNAEEHVGCAREAAAAALRNDPGSGPARTVLARLLWRDGDNEAAERELRSALESAPGSAPPHRWLGLLLTATRRIAEGEARMARAVQLDPQSAPTVTGLGEIRYFARRYDEAVAQLGRALRIDAESADALTFLARAHEMQGRYTDAVDAYRRLARGRGADSAAVEAVSAVIADSAGSRTYHRLMLGLIGEAWPDAWFARARQHARLGDTAAAIDALERSLSRREPAARFLAVEPAFESLQDDAAFVAMLERTNLR